MAKTNRPSGLAGILAKNWTPGAPAVTTPNKVKEARVSVIVRLTAVERKSLRMIALEQDTTVQALVERAVREVIARAKKVTK